MVAPVPIVQILPAAAAKADIVADRLQHPHHLLIEMARVQSIALRFTLLEQGRNIILAHALLLAALIRELNC